MSAAPQRPAKAEVEIRGAMIRLGQLLKLAGIVASGAEAKLLLEREEVAVNGQPERRRGRQLHQGDRVSVAGEELSIRARDADGPHSDSSAHETQRGDITARLPTPPTAGPMLEDMVQVDVPRRM